MPISLFCNRYGQRRLTLADNATGRNRGFSHEVDTVSNKFDLAPKNHIFTQIQSKASGGILYKLSLSATEHRLRWLPQISSLQKVLI